MVLRNAEDAAKAREEKAAADAEMILQHAKDDSDAFWQDVNELLQQQLFARGGSSNGK